MLWGGVDVAPTGALKASVAGDTINVASTTVSVTCTIKGLFVACCDIRVMVAE
jgi:hypothetical protein